LDLSKVKKLPEADIIIHAAENSAKKTSLARFKKSIKLSSKITDNLVKFLKKSKKKIYLIYLSSGAVYDSNKKLVNIKEDNKLIKNNLKTNNFKYLYGLNKIQSEKKLLKIKKKHNIIILRLFSLLGKNVPENSNYILGNIKKSIRTKKVLKLYSSNLLSTYRSFLDVNDLIICIFKLIEKKSKLSSPIFNLGSDKSYLLIELLNKIAKKFNFSYKLNKQQIQNIDYYVPNIAKLQNTIRYRINRNTYNLIKNYLSSK
jgi:nucleoside-diphosphate-sugar epimerase